MSRPDVIRAWKDVEYRASLSASEIEMMPAHPAGLVEINDADLGGVAGGTIRWSVDFCVTITACATFTLCTILACPPINTIMVEP